MKTRRLLLPLLLITIVFLTACGTDGDQQATKESAFIGGTQGISASFEAFGVEEDGKLTIFDTETFPIEITLQNKGEYELKPQDVTVSLLGPAQEDFNGVSAWELQNQVTIEPISELVTTGGEETLTFATDAQYLGEVTGFFDQKWVANIEYNYETQVIVPEVCLKEDLTDTRLCEVKETKTVFVSGAPVAVTAVEEDTAGKGVMALKFTVINNGAGDITKQGEEFQVNDRLSFGLDDPAWECKSGGKVGEARLLSGSAEVVCKLKEALPAGTLATKQVKLTLKYKYRDLVQSELRIKESAS